MKKKITYIYLICLLSISCFVLIGCGVTGNMTPSRTHPPTEYFDEVIAWGPNQYNVDSNMRSDGVGYVSDLMDAYADFYTYDDICNLGILSDEDLKAVKKNSSYSGAGNSFSIYFGIKDGEDYVYLYYQNCDSFTVDKIVHYFKSNLNFKFEDLLKEFEQITGIEMTKEIVDPEDLHTKTKKLNEETGEYYEYILHNGIYFDILKDSEYTFDFIFTDENLKEYHVYK